MATIYPLHHIETYIDRKPVLDTLEEQIKEKLHNTYFKACRLCEIYRTIIVIIVTCLIIGAIILSVMLKTHNNVNPCYYYTETTLASDVSVQCVMHLWNSFKCSTAFQSNPTWRWWIQSPKGLTMVKCNAVHKGILCGAGSYNIIRNYIQMCNSRYGQ